jgi:hypothetical protein
MTKLINQFALVESKIKTFLYELDVLAFVIVLNMTFLSLTGQYTRIKLLYLSS